MIIRILLAFIGCCSVAFAFGALLAFLGKYHWLLDLCSHFRLFYALGLLPGILIFWFFRHRVLATCLILVFMINAISIGSMWLPLRRDTLNIPEGPVVRILQMNVSAFNEQYRQLASFFIDSQSDILILAEYVNHHALKIRMTDVVKLYPYSVRDVMSGNVIYSRFPLVSRIEFGAVNDHNVILEATALIPYKNKVFPLHILAVHPERPNRGKDVAKRQLIYFEKAAHLINHLPKSQPVLIAGDFNTTPWSYPYLFITEKTGMENASQGLGLLSSFPCHLKVQKWPISLLPAYPMMPIDQMLVKGPLRVLSRSAQSCNGSDHVPIMTVIQLRQR